MSPGYSSGVNLEFVNYRNIEIMNNMKTTTIAALCAVVGFATSVTGTAVHAQEEDRRTEAAAYLSSPNDLYAEDDSINNHISGCFVLGDINIQIFLYARVCLPRQRTSVGIPHRF